MMGGAAPATPDASFFIGMQHARSNRNGYWNPLKDAFLGEFRSEFIARLRELDKTILHPDNIAPLVDAAVAEFDIDDAASAPAGAPCAGQPLIAGWRIKEFARARSFRIALGMFD